MIENISTVLPIIAVTSLVCGFLGWSMRGPGAKPMPTKTSKPAPVTDKGQQDRVKNLEATLEKSKSAHKQLKSELEVLQSSSVTKAAHEETLAELVNARKALDTESKRSSAIDADFKKSQETIKQLNARTNDADKSQKDRRFALENELSKVRGELAVLQNRPDDSAVLQQEIERLKESVAVSTRYAGEMRKREAAAAEALEKAEGRIAESGVGLAQVTASRKIGPVVESGRIAAAKAEVLRLVELNKQKDAEPAVEKISPIVNVVAPVLAAVVSPLEQVIPSFETVVAMAAKSEEAVTVLETVVVTPETVEIVAEEARVTVKQDELPLTATVG
jgi:myosin heavy subunit